VIPPPFLQAFPSAAGFFRRAKDVQVRGDERSWVLRGTSDRRWTYAGGEALTLLEPFDTHFAAIDPALADTVAGQRGLRWRRDAKTFTLKAERTLPRGTHEVSQLTAVDAPIIDEQWEHRDDVSLAYLCDRIERDPALGVRVNGALVGWELVHDDGALGAAFVLPEFRRRGIMRSLQWAMVEALRRRALPVFKHVALDNHGWLEAQEPAGWTVVGRSSWLEVRP
jgi:GNAT superfamily N-acetyltransferase